MDEPQADVTMQRPPIDLAVSAARWLAYFLDDCGLDPIMGFLLPGLGDALGSALGLVTVGVATGRRYPRRLIARMLLNLAVEGLLGTVPLAGDAFDAAFRAHSRNLKILDRGPTIGAARAWDWLILWAAGLCFVLALLLPVAIFALLTAWGLHALRGG